VNIEELLEQYRDNDYYNLSKIENITKLCEEIERLNNIINSIENEVRNTTEEMYKTLVKIDGRGYYSANLTRLDYLLDKIKALKAVKLTENDKKQVKWLKEEFKVDE